MSSFEIDSSREVAASSPPLSDRGDGPVPVCHSPSGAGPSAIAWHEASHAIVAKHYGMPVSVVTIVAGRWFAGRCLGPAPCWKIAQKPFLPPVKPDASKPGPLCRR
jgi:hypothetical protein